MGVTVTLFVINDGRFSGYNENMCAEFIRDLLKEASCRDGHLEETTVPEIESVQEWDSAIELARTIQARGWLVLP